jgi:hypothetical protein
MEIKHVCQGCDQLLAAHNHSPWLEVKQCLRGMKALCAECAK